MKIRFNLLFQHKLNRGLCDTVGNGRDAEGPFSTRLLWNRYRFHWGWEVAPRRHSIPDPIQVITERFLKLLEGLLVHSGCSLICLHALVRFPYKPFWNFKRLCRGHSLLPIQVGEDFGRTTRLLGSKSITDPSTLLRVGPPLRCASVLWVSRLLLLTGSLNITTQVLAVPHKSPNRARAISMPDTAHPVSRFPMDLSRSNKKTPVLMSSRTFSTLVRWFTGVRLLGSYLTRLSRLFPLCSRQGLLTNAAEGGLRPAPAGRPRRVGSSISYAASHTELGAIALCVAATHFYQLSRSTTR